MNCRHSDRPPHAPSHGESFFALFENRLTRDGLYIMEQSEAARSPQRQLAFLARLHQLVRAGSQRIIATHSPIILGDRDAWIYQASERGLERVDCEDTEHDSVTRGFLHRRETFWKSLLEEDE